MPFWNKKPAQPIDPDSLALTQEQMRQAAGQAVNHVLSSLMAQQRCTLDELRTPAYGKPLEDAVLSVMEAGATAYYAQQSEQLQRAGLQDDRYLQVVGENANRINVEIIEMLIGMGCKLEHLRPEACGHEAGDEACQSCTVLDCVLNRAGPTGSVD